MPRPWASTSPRAAQDGGGQQAGAGEWGQDVGRQRAGGWSRVAITEGCTPAGPGAGDGTTGGEDRTIRGRRRRPPRSDVPAHPAHAADRGIHVRPGDRRLGVGGGHLHQAPARVEAAASAHLTAGRAHVPPQRMHQRRRALPGRGARHRPAPGHPGPRPGAAGRRRRQRTNLRRHLGQHRRDRTAFVSPRATGSRRWWGGRCERSNSPTPRSQRPQRRGPRLGWGGASRSTDPPTDELGSEA